jgi:hypothetical protein
MKTINKVLLGLATATTIVAPLVPKNINVNITMQAQSTVHKEKPYKLVSTTCDLKASSTTDLGMQVCEYSCRGGDKVTIYKTFRTNAVSCPNTVHEKVKETSRQ